MSNVIQSDPKLRECVAEHMYTYALGRGYEVYDEHHLTQITEKYSEAGGGFRDLIREIVLSESFRKRRGDNSVDDSVDQSTSEEGAE